MSPDDRPAACTKTEGERIAEDRVTEDQGELPEVDRLRIRPLHQHGWYTEDEDGKQREAQATVHGEHGLL
jgi:hypothetical protein